MIPFAGDEPVFEPFKTSKGVEEYVRAYFIDIPIMAEIAGCESRFRHFNEEGSILRGDINRYDIGVMQINELYHGEKANELGNDLYTLDGNLTHARYLYEKSGTAPWNASEECWRIGELAFAQ